MADQHLTPERLREILHYDPATGIFSNKNPRKKIVVGTQSGGLDRSTGYIVIGIDRRRYYAHRLAFFYINGEWPPELVDHIDGNKTNNIFTNLRQVSRLVNQQNMKLATKSSSSGLLGAYRKRKKWSSKIRVGGRVINLGTFDTAMEAHLEYIKAKRIHHQGCTI